VELHHLLHRAALDDFQPARRLAQPVGERAQIRLPRLFALDRDADPELEEGDTEDRVRGEGVLESRYR